MTGRRWLLAAVAAAILGLGLWMGFYPADWQNWLGFSKAAYFTNGQNYAFASGVGPMLLTATGMSTIIVGGWHHVNCHYDGCMRIGKHKINGTPWCTTHQDAARSQVTLEDKLDRLIDLLTEQAKK